MHLSTKCHLNWQIGQDCHLVFLISPKNTNLVDDVEILLPVKFRWIPFSCLRRCLNQSDARVAILFHSACTSVPSHIWLKYRCIWRKTPINSTQFDWPENTNIVEDVGVVRPVKFRWIPFSRFRGEVKNVSTNQRPRRPSCFSDRPEKHKLGRRRWDLASCQVSLNYVQRFRKRSRKCLSQAEAMATVLFFRSVLKTQTWQKTLRSCFLSSFVEFRLAVSEEESKMWS